MGVFTFLITVAVTVPIAIGVSIAYCFCVELGHHGAKDVDAGQLQAA
jgi:hypothetical protein